MSLKSSATKIVGNATRTIVTAGRHAQRGNANVEIVLASLLREPHILASANDAVAFVEMLRGCLEPFSQPVESVKAHAETHDEMTIRFDTIVQTIQTGMFPLPPARAMIIAAEADRMLGNRSPIVSQKWIGDAGLHLAVSSSTGHKGRLLATILRLRRAHRCLELGTAYGLSGLFMLGQEVSQERQVHLETVEGMDPQYSLAREMLNRLHPNQVNCHLGWTGDVLPGLMNGCEPFDFVFHDAGHTRHDYVNDFAAVVDHLSAGALMVIDDINWDDVRFTAGSSGAYEGWRQVVAHERVTAAVEIDGTIGLALIA